MPTKIFTVLCILMHFCFGQTSAQNLQLYKGVYTDSLCYSPIEKDTFKFEFYADGTQRLFEDKESILITDFLDVTYRKLNYTLFVYKFIRGATEFDSIKTVYLYNGKINNKSVAYQRLAFQQSGGCFVYTNENTMFWYRTGFTTYEYDQNQNCIKQIEYSQHKGTNDTFVSANKFIYDKKKRIKTHYSFRQDTLFRIIQYEYHKNAKKEMTFNFKNELISTNIELKQNGKVIQTINNSKYGYRISELTDYYYNKDGMLSKQLFYNVNQQGSKELYKVRTYHYTAS